MNYQQFALEFWRTRAMWSANPAAETGRIELKDGRFCVGCTFDYKTDAPRERATHTLSGKPWGGR